MFSSGNVTVHVSNMDAAVRFYTETLGLKLAYRFGDNWASVEVGRGLTIGLHPASAKSPPGRKGSMAIGLELDGSIREAVRSFLGPINEDKAGSFAAFEDIDGQPVVPGGTEMEPRGKGRGPVSARLANRSEKERRS